MIDEDRLHACVVCGQPTPREKGLKYVMELEGGPELSAHVSCIARVTAVELLEKYKTAVYEAFDVRIT
jgi:hypothetical protein